MAESMSVLWMNLTKREGGCVDPVSSFRVYLSRGEYERVKRLCRERGLSLCRVISDFLRACLEVPDLVESPGGVKGC